MVITELKSRINANRYIALFVACVLGVLFSLAQDVAQVLLLPIGEWAQRRFLATPDATFLKEQVVNFSFQALAGLVPSLVVLFAMAKLLNLNSMFYPSVAAICNLTISLWWLPISLVVGFSPTMQKALPFLPASFLGWLLVYFGTAYLVVRRHNAL